MESTSPVSDRNDLCSGLGGRAGVRLFLADVGGGQQDPTQSGFPGELAVLQSQSAAQVGAGTSPILKSDVAAAGSGVGLAQQPLLRRLSWSRSGRPSSAGFRGRNAASAGGQSDEAREGEAMQQSTRSPAPAGTFAASVPVKHFRPSRPAVHVAQLMPIHRDSVLYRTCVETYRRHCGGQDGLCQSCQLPTPCPPRISAASGIQMAGDSSNSHDVAQPGFDVLVEAPTSEAVEPRWATAVVRCRLGLRAVMGHLVSRAVGVRVAGVGGRNGAHRGTAYPGRPAERMPHVSVSSVPQSQQLMVQDRLLWLDAQRIAAAHQPRADDPDTCSGCSGSCPCTSRRAADQAVAASHRGRLFTWTAWHELRSCLARASPGESAGRGISAGLGPVEPL